MSREDIARVQAMHDKVDDLALDVRTSIEVKVAQCVYYKFVTVLSTLVCNLEFFLDRKSVV